MKKIKNRWLTQAALFLMIAGVVIAQDAEPAHRPTIGLVLEGGGALGFAHIGVIEWLDQHHIPIDYVAGTSMGGLVGGLYASGESSADLKRFVNTVDWSVVLSGQTPFQALSFRRKEDKEAYPNRLEFGLRHGFSVPRGLNSGSAIALLFAQTLLPYYDLKSFDDLPIPFRCVATDITTGEEHIFDSGSLPLALRATMSIPLIFTPVQLDGHTYSDGGAVNNLPVDVARAMGADIVIAVYLDTGAVDAATLKSPLSVAGRNINIMMAENERKNLADADILLSARIAPALASAYGSSELIIPTGVAAAEAKASELDKLALSDSDWAAYVSERDARKRTAVPIPRFVYVRGVSAGDQKQIAAEMQKFLGRPIDIDELDRQIADLQSTGMYAGVTYSLQNRAGEAGLVIEPIVKQYGPPFLDLGFTISSSDLNNIQFGLGGRITFMNVAGAGSELRADLGLGQTAGATVELFKPIKQGWRLFVAPRAYATQTGTAVYSGSQELAQYREVHRGIGADIGFIFDARDQLRIGEDYQVYENYRVVGSPLYRAFNFTPAITSIRFDHLGEDDVMIPTRGSIIHLLAQYYDHRPTSGGGYQQGSASAAHFFPVLNKDAIYVDGSGGTTWNASNLGLAGFNLGGPLRLSAYNFYELSGDSFVLAEGGYLHHLFNLNPVIGDAVYVDGFYEAGRVYGYANTNTLGQDVAVALLAKTLIGPIYTGVSIGDGGHRKWFFGLGRVF